MTALRRWRSETVSLTDALAATFEALGAGATLIGLCSAPAAWRFAVLARDAAGQATADWGGADPLDWAEIFDLRAFVPARGFELRWRATRQGGLGAWLTTDAGFDPAKLGATPIRDITIADRIASRRLLFGETAEAPSSGWVALREARIGTLFVPVAEPGRRFEIRGIELVARDDEFGNAHVAEELLLDIGSTAA